MSLGTLEPAAKEQSRPREKAQGLRQDRIHRNSRDARGSLGQNSRKERRCSRSSLRGIEVNVSILCPSCGQYGNIESGWETSKIVAATCMGCGSRITAFACSTCGGHGWYGPIPCACNGGIEKKSISSFKPGETQENKLEFGNKTNVHRAKAIRRK